MEILNQLWASQESLEDALRLESTPEEIKDTKEGKRLLKYVRHRRRVVSYLTRIINKI